MPHLSRNGSHNRLSVGSRLAETKERIISRYANVREFAADHGWLEDFTREVLDPDQDILIRQSRRRDIYLRMRWRNHEIAAAFEQLVNPIIGADWHVVPAPGDDSPDSTDRAKILTRDIETSPGFTKVLEGLAEIVWQGYGGVELNGSVGGLGDVLNGEPLVPAWPDDTAPTEIPRFALTFEQSTGRPRLLTHDSDSTDGIALDRPEWRWKFLIGQYGSTEGGNWFGSGLALRCYWLYVFNTQTLKDWVTALERYASPEFVISVLEGDYAKQRAAARIALRDHAANGNGWILPKGVALEELAGTGNRSFPGYEVADERFSAALHKAILGQTLTMEQGQRGSQALGRVHRAGLTDRQWHVIQRMQDWGTPLIRYASELRWGNYTGHRLEVVFEEIEDAALNVQQASQAQASALVVNSDEHYRKLGYEVPKDAPPTIDLGAIAPMLPAPGVTPPSVRPLPFQERTESDREAGIQDRRDDVQDDAISAFATDVTRELGKRMRSRLAQKKTLGWTPSPAPTSSGLTTSTGS